MEWQTVGRLPVSIRPRGPLSLARLARARVPAERWSVETDVGAPASTAFANSAALDRLLDCRARDGRLTTARSPEFYRWRYGTPLLHYRVVTAPGGLDRGFVVFRLRRRGPALEAAVGDVVAPAADARTAIRLLRAVRRSSGADYLIALGARLPGFVPFPNQGPILTWRHVRAEPTAVPVLGALACTLGDIELF